MLEEEEKAIEILSLKAITSSAEAPEYPNTIVMKKDLVIILNLISKLQKELEHKEKLINDFARVLAEEEEESFYKFYNKEGRGVNNYVRRRI